MYVFLSKMKKKKQNKKNDQKVSHSQSHAHKEWRFNLECYESNSAEKKFQIIIEIVMCIVYSLVHLFTRTRTDRTEYISAQYSYSQWAQQMYCITRRRIRQKKMARNVVFYANKRLIKLIDVRYETILLTLYNNN